ncbi:MAG TPA: polysaccharide biosynthesis/export family protein, partial [Thermoanaerobaculia bacterium]|nr:polysaccharide biosynthesis/export family protein [Thermoanaerobaculia bacterium]
RAEGSSLEIDVPSSAPGTATADAPATLLHSFVPTPRHEPEPYRIAAGDLLEIDVLGFSELDRRVRVGDDGGVPLPLVGRVEVQGMSIEAAQERLAGALVEAEILNEPIVIVTLAQASRDTVAVHGAVNAPGLYVLPRPATVMEVLIWAGGLTDRVAEPHRAIVLRGDTSGEPRRFVDLAALLGGTSSEPDPMLHPGDALLVPVAEVIQVFLAGAVRRPGPVVAAPGSDLNVLEALAVVGGATERGSLDKVSVHRLKPFGRQTTIRVDVDATQRGRIPPLPLQTGDVVFVPFWPAFGQSYDVTAEELLSAPPGARAPGPSQP